MLPRRTAPLRHGASSCSSASWSCTPSDMTCRAFLRCPPRPSWSRCATCGTHSGAPCRPSHTHRRHPHPLCSPSPPRPTAAPPAWPASVSPTCRLQQPLLLPAGHRATAGTLSASRRHRLARLSIRMRPRRAARRSRRPRSVRTASGLARRSRGGGWPSMTHSTSSPKSTPICRPSPTRPCQTPPPHRCPHCSSASRRFRRGSRRRGSSCRQRETSCKRASLVWPKRRRSGRRDGKGCVGVSVGCSP
mmetsp:Transcript_2192/g.5917  ORF Transcript_2192/g.5917 Transcript_2192/m.5917 type:complete len:247 (+) Transcript_2192:352-1092(+)